VLSTLAPATLRAELLSESRDRELLASSRHWTHGRPRRRGNSRRSGWFPAESRPSIVVISAHPTSEVGRDDFYTTGPGRLAPKTACRSDLAL